VSGRWLSGTSDNNCIKLSKSLAFDMEHLLYTSHYNCETKILSRLHHNHLRMHARPHAHTHTHTQPFYGSLDFVHDNLGEPVSEKNIHPLTVIMIINHLLSAFSIYYDTRDPPYSICAWQSFSTIPRQVFFGLPLSLSGGVLAWLSVWGEVQIFIWPSWCHCHSLSLAPVNSDCFGFTFLVPAHPGIPRQSPGCRKMVVVVAVVVL